MALLTSEIQRIKYESGFNELSLSALPYTFDGVTQIFEQVIQPYLLGGALTSSSTTVTAVATGSSPVAIQLTLADATGFHVMDRVIVDQDVAQEAAHVSAISGSAITLPLFKAHQGTYPVTVEGGESIVRELLGECIKVGKRISTSAARAGIKRADEVEFFPTVGTQLGVRGELMELQRYWRNELCSALGIPNLREQRAGAGQSLVSA